MKVQTILTVLPDLSSPLPSIDKRERFPILDGDIDAVGRHRKNLRLNTRRCCYCGKTCVKHGTLDHRIPIARGGLATVGNLALACGFCNRSKSDLTDRQFVALILTAVRKMRRRIRHERLRGRQLSMANAVRLPVVERSHSLELVGAK